MSIEKALKDLTEAVKANTEALLAGASVPQPAAAPEPKQQEAAPAPEPAPEGEGVPTKKAVTEAATALGKAKGAEVVRSILAAVNPEAENVHGLTDAQRAPFIEACQAALDAPEPEAAEETPAPAAEPVVPSVSFDDLKPAMQARVARDGGSTDGVVAILAEFSAKKAGDLKPEQYGAFVAKLEAGA